MKQLLALVLGLGLASSGCATEMGGGGGYHAHYAHGGGHSSGGGGHWHGDSGDAILGGLVAIADLVELASQPSDDAEGDAPAPVLPGEIYANGPPMPGEARPRPQVTAPDPEHVHFDSTAAAVAVHGVDLSSCVARGVPQTYGHARVTFGSTGAASRVVVDSPPNLSADAVECLGEKLGQASAPPFDGAPVTIGTSFYVR